MKRAKKGHIVAISSVAGKLQVFSYKKNSQTVLILFTKGLHTLVHSEPYCSTKFAVRTLMRVMRADLMIKGIRDIHFTTVFPYFLQTNAKVNQLADDIGISDIYPLLDGEEVAKRSVAGMLRGEVEVVIPSVIGLLYRLNK